ncbi:MAG: hypothetical protein JSS02_33380 [Planctomycetes bacterium]|nr:hypothetical protein [Planctomycetota bacterium]
MIHIPTTVPVRWSSELPLSHLDGYYTLLRGRCCLAFDQPRIAVLEAGDLLGVAQDDPYADQLLLLMAEAQLRLKEAPAATATLQRLLADYPGSPLTSTAQTWLQDGFSNTARPERSKSVPTKKKRETKPP